MSEFDDIRALVEVVNLGGLARAARQLGVAKSIVSRRIARLEADLGTRLLNRTARGITPTDAGLEFKLRCERVMRELSEARELVAQEQGELAGKLRLSLPLSFGNRYVASELAEWCRANPRLEIDAAYSDRVVDLLEERFDAAIRIGSLKDSTLVARLIGPVRLVIVASPEYLSRHKPPTSPQDLAEHECLLYSGPRERSPWLFHAERRRMPILPTGRFSADSGEALLRGAEAGLGVTMLPTFLAADSLRSERLIRLLPDFRLSEEGLFVVRPPGVYVPAKVRALTDLMIDKFGSEPAWDRP